MCDVCACPAAIATPAGAQDGGNGSRLHRPLVPAESVTVGAKRGFSVSPAQSEAMVLMSEKADRYIVHYIKANAILVPHRCVFCLSTGLHPGAFPQISESG